MKMNNSLSEIINWMLTKLEKDGCLYQDDKKLLAEFERQTRDNVVWVRSEFYWRFRVKEDEPGRIARG